MDANLKEKLVPATAGFLVGAVFAGALARLGKCPFQKGASEEKKEEEEPQINSSPVITSQVENKQFPANRRLSIRYQSDRKQLIQVDSRRAAATTNEAVGASQQTDKAKTLQDIQMINRAFAKHFIFNALNQENIDACIQCMIHFTLDSDKPLFEQGDPARYFWVLVTGKLEVLVNGNRVNLIGPGGGFGELALMHDTPRTASIKSVRKWTLWGLDRKSFQEALTSVNAGNYEENKLFIDQIPIFTLLSPSQKEAMVEALSSHRYIEGHRIVHEGDPGDLFYLIKEGTVSVTRNGSEITQMGRGEFFGEMALLYDTPRTATVTAVSEVSCVSLGREELKDLLGNKLQQILYRNSLRHAFQQNEILKSLSQEQTDAIISAMQVSKYQSGDVVIPKMIQHGTCLWIVVKGSLRYESQEEAFAEEFTCIGENFIVEEKLQETFFEEPVVANEETDVAMIEKEAFYAAIGDSFEDAIAFNAAAERLKQVQLLEGIDPGRFKQLVHSLTSSDYADGQTIVSAAESTSQFFIVQEGTVKVTKNGQEMRQITKDDFYGERSILFQLFDGADVTSVGNSQCWTIDRTLWLDLLDEGVRSQLLLRIEIQDTSVELEDLAIVRVLGTGMFGNVYLAANAAKSTLYALKTVTRNKIEQFNLQKHIQLERSVLMKLDHTMILKLIKTFKDEKRIYFLTEYIQGQDLFDAIRSIDLIKDNDAKFYTSCMVEIFAYLHERSILYRDLKPENVMIDKQGYPKLIDFGTAKQVQGRTFTIVGTPHYMAPEIIIGKGYGPAADWWSLGILLYELVCGTIPFGAEEEDPYSVYECVVTHQLKYPNYVDPNFKSKAIIEIFLDKNPGGRILGDIAQLKAHPWFGEVDWQGLIRRTIPPPYKPPVQPIDAEVNSAIKGHKGTNQEDIHVANESEQDRKLVESTEKPDWDADF